MRSVISRWPATLLAALVLLAVMPGTASATAAGNGNTLTGDADLVVVMKAERELYLYRDGLIIAQYPIALGLAPVGTKRMRGDDKTPIGAYTLDWRNPNSDFHRSIHISYPNAADRARAAALGVPPGRNIMIHGQPDYDDRPRTGDWTHGCIAVSNAAIDQIWAHVPDGTPIHIYP
ncbi:L,D-transpeptidase family protein [Salinisphaera sp.]|uniref:L,D-transpeptidase family protein n=1 Tax=Salinisphaera sp. TaxID=1914330 RepID=UPI002D79EAA7|nr:L,D-transpeptidase family protein [Salinisphaera sp.]HET7315440.1 L,D-transpeptidase family protein [Salinisphaera sp.]